MPPLAASHEHFTGPGPAASELAVAAKAVQLRGEGVAAVNFKNCPLG